MNIEITTTRTIEIDDDDDAGLARLTEILDRHGVQGDTLYDKVEELNRYDPQGVLVALVAEYGDRFDCEHSVSDFEIDGIYGYEDEDEDSEVDALNLPAWR